MNQKLAIKFNRAKHMSYLLFEVEVNLTKENFLRRNKGKDALGGSDFPITWLYKDSHFFVVIHILNNESFLTLAISSKPRMSYTEEEIGKIQG